MTTINKYIKINNYNWKTSKNTMFPDRVVIYPDIKISADKKIWESLNTKIEIVFKNIQNINGYAGSVGYVGSYGYIGSVGYKSTLPVYLDTEEVLKNNTLPLPTGFDDTNSTVITDRQIQVEYVKQLTEIRNGYLLG